MELKFWKMHGARNDFVLFDDRDGLFPAKDRAFIKHIADRHAGIGAEGVILLQTDQTAGFLMRFFNPDGGEAELCGNGARCAARLAQELGLCGDRMTIATQAGEIAAQVEAGGVKLFMPNPSHWIPDEVLELDNGMTLSYSHINTGVPHVVLRTGDVAGVDVRQIGEAVRRHRRFAPEGANVNFMEITSGGGLRVRTYERGVEAETPACGTGVTACGLVAARNGWITLPVLVRVSGGDALVVDGELTDESARHVTLTGPAEHVFEGVIPYNPRPPELFNHAYDSQSSD